MNLWCSQGSIPVTSIVTFQAKSLKQKAWPEPG